MGARLAFPSGRGGGPVGGGRRGVAALRFGGFARVPRAFTHPAHSFGMTRVGRIQDLVHSGDVAHFAAVGFLGFLLRLGVVIVLQLADILPAKVTAHRQHHDADADDRELEGGVLLFHRAALEGLLRAAGAGRRARDLSHAGGEPAAAPGRLGDQRIPRGGRSRGCGGLGLWNHHFALASGALDLVPAPEFITSDFLLAVRAIELHVGHSFAFSNGVASLARASKDQRAGLQ